MAAHRYWRLQFFGEQTYTILGEVSMAVSGGGADQCSGGTALGNYTTPYVPANAYDDDLTTGWKSDSSGDRWIGYDFGSGNDKDVVEIKVQMCSDAADINMKQSAYYPIGFNVYFSDDNSEWTLQSSHSCGTWAGTSDLKTFDLTVGVVEGFLNAPGSGLTQRATFLFPASQTKQCLQLFSRPGVRRYRWHEYGGNYHLAGHVYDASARPTKARIDLLRQKSSILVDRVYSSPDDGAFDIPDISIGPWTILIVDDSGDENSLVFGHLVPVTQ